MGASESSDKAESTPLIQKRNKLSCLDGKNLVLGFYFGSAVIVAAGNSISWKSTLNAFRPAEAGQGKNLEYFVNQFTIFLYLVLALGVLAYRWFFSNLITKEQRQFPIKKFIFMGFLDAVCGLFSAIGGAYTDGQVQTLINQGNIPITMILSLLLIEVKYTRFQYYGAILIICGAGLAVMPSFLTKQETEQSHSNWWGNLIFMISLLPNALSNVYKEVNFKQDGLDVYYLTCWVTTWQFVWGFLFSPILAFPAFGGVPLREIPTQMSQGWDCFLGTSVEGFQCDVSPQPYIPLLAYVFINFSYNVLLLLITKHGSAVLLVIASALSLPFTNIIFTVPWIMGQNAEAFSLYDLFGLCIVVVGFLMYSLIPDSETGEFMPAQGPAGQMMYIKEVKENPREINRRKSVTLPLPIASPSVYSHVRQTPTMNKKSKSLPSTREEGYRYLGSDRLVEAEDFYTARPNEREI